MGPKIFVRRIDLDLLDPSQLAQLIDHAVLNPGMTLEELRRQIEEACKYDFAVLMVPPCHIRFARGIARRKGVRIGTVAGFPLGNTSTMVKEAEARRAIEDGAEEIDMVINIGLFRSGLRDYVLNEVGRIVEIGKESGAIVKAIIETGMLSDQEKVEACRLIKEAKADFVKTCTGFGPGRATVHDVVLLREASWPEVKVKASGGIGHLEDVIVMIEAGADRVGTSSGIRIMKEFTAKHRY